MNDFIDKFYKGRINRKYWWISLLLIKLIGHITDSLKLPPNDIMRYIAAFIIILIILSVDIRRWHDLGFSGWLSIFSLIPGFEIIRVFFLGLLPGNKTGNKYGTIPS